MYHSLNRRCVLSFFTNRSCLFTKTRLVNQSCHHAVFRKLGGRFLWSRISNLPSSWCVTTSPPTSRSFFKARVSRALLVYHSFLPMSHICHSPKLQGIACSSLKISFWREKSLRNKGTPQSLSRNGSRKVGKETALRASSNLLPCFHVWFWGTFQTVTVTLSIPPFQSSSTVKHLA